MNADDLATALTTGASGWLVLSIAAVAADPVGVHAVMHFARPYVVRFLQTPDPAVRRRRLVAELRADPGRRCWSSRSASALIFLFPTCTSGGPADHGPAGDGRPVLGPVREAPPGLRRRRRRLSGS